MKENSLSFWTDRKVSLWVVMALTIALAVETYALLRVSKQLKENRTLALDYQGMRDRYRAKINGLYSAYSDETVDYIKADLRGRREMEIAKEEAVNSVRGDRFEDTMRRFRVEDEFSRKAVDRRWKAAQHMLTLSNHFLMEKIVALEELQSEIERKITSR